MLEVIDKTPSRESHKASHASIDAGQQAHRFEFPTIDASAVQEVLPSTSGGRCFVIGGPT